MTTYPELVRSIDLRVIRDDQIDLTDPSTNINDIVAAWTRAFLDGMHGNTKVYDRYHVYERCEVIANTSVNCLKVPNKHLAVVFYDQNKHPIRLALSSGRNHFRDICSALTSYHKQASDTTTWRELTRMMKTRYAAITDLEHTTHPKINLSKVDLPEIQLLSARQFPRLNDNVTEFYKTVIRRSGVAFPSGKYDLSPGIIFTYHLEIPDYTFHINHQGCYNNEELSHFIVFQSDTLPPQLELEF